MLSGTTCPSFLCPSRIHWVSSSSLKAWKAGQRAWIRSPAQVKMDQLSVADQSPCGEIWEPTNPSDTPLVVSDGVSDKRPTQPLPRGMSLPDLLLVPTLMEVSGRWCR